MWISTQIPTQIILLDFMRPLGTIWTNKWIRLLILFKRECPGHGQTSGWEEEEEEEGDANWE